MRTALVTGAGGFIGSHLTTRLARGGIRVRALCRDGRQASRLRRSGAEPIRGDVTDEIRIACAARGIDVVFHCASGGTSADDLRRVNVDGTVNVLRAAADAAVERVVHVSSMAVHEPRGDVLTEDVPLRASGGPYATSKADGERAAWDVARQTGLPLAVVRPGIVYGPGSPMWTLAFLERVRSMRLALVAGGRTTANLVYVDDVVEALLLCATEPAAAGDAFLVSAAEPTTWREYVSHLCRMARRPLPPSLPTWRAHVAASAGRWSSRLTRQPARIEPADLALMLHQPTICIDKARRLLGFDPQVTLGEGMLRTEAWLRDEGWLPPAA